MRKDHRILIYLFLVFIGFMIGFILSPIVGNGEEVIEKTPMYVTASLLNGRENPSKKSQIWARFDHGDEVNALGWSDNHHWIEVEGGESGTVWVWWEYLTERTEEYSTWWNNYGGKVKIRKEPYGRVIGYLKKDKEVVVTQIVLGWGKIRSGWIDLSYLTEEE